MNSSREAMSPWAGFAGRSSSTSAPASSPRSAASAATTSAGNGLARGEEVLEAADLLRRSDPDQHVPGLDQLLGVGGGVEPPVRLADRDHHRPGLLAHPQLAKRPPGPCARRRDLDLLEPEVVALGGHYHVEEPPPLR